MVEMKKVTIVPDNYNNVDLKTLNPFEVAVFKLTTTNKIFVKDIPAGVSKTTGKPYQSFKTYSIKLEHNGSEVYLKLPNGGVASEVEHMSVGDSFEVTCLKHPKGKQFIVEKL